MTDLFTPLQAGDLALPNRILMAPLTRCRAEAGHVPGELMAAHYAQRASSGLLIYYTATEGQGWDGKYNGVDQGNGVYIWVLEFYDQNNKLVIEKGTLTLIR